MFSSNTYFFVFICSNKIFSFIEISIIQLDLLGRVLENIVYILFLKHAYVVSNFETFRLS